MGSSIIDQPNILYETLLRLSRKIMAISLVIDNQKMIYVPQNAEELEEIGEHLTGFNNIVVTQRRRLKSIESNKVREVNEKEDGDEQPPQPSPHSPSSIDYGNDDNEQQQAKQELEALIFSNRTLYKTSSICKK